MNRLATLQAPFATHSLSFSSKLDHPSDNSSSYSNVHVGAPARLRRPIHKAAPGVALFAPIHYERRYAYPLLVWLHGDGSSERELRQLMPNVSVRNYVGAAARGLPSPSSTGECSWRQTPDDIESAADAVAETIDYAKRQYHIHPGRIFLAGRDSGGSMALRLALQCSLPIAGAASLGGAVPRGGCLLAHVDKARRVPIMLMCARESQIYPSAQVADDLRLLHAAGCQLAIREYLCGDELFTDMFNDLDQWMMQLVCGTPAAAIV
jgi:phospholipase/carboxylesterase